MKRLRNIAFYYIIFGALCALSFIFFDFLWVGVIGVALLLFYYVARYIFKAQTIFPGVSKNTVTTLSILFVLLPPLSLLGAELYYHRPFKQMITVTPNYEGVIIVEYGSNKQVNNTYYNGYRLIQANSTGTAQTSFKIPGYISSPVENTLISVENNKSAQIPILYSDPANNDIQTLRAYLIDYTNDYQTYVVTKNYRKFFKPNSFNEPNKATELRISVVLDSLSKFN